MKLDRPQQIEEEISVLDARKVGGDVASARALVGRGIEYTGSGVVDVFRVLVLDDYELMESHASLYEELLRSPLSLNLIVLATTHGRRLLDVSSQHPIPQVFQEHFSRLRLLVIEDDDGVLVSPGRLRPHALAVWPDKPDDQDSTQLIEEVLINPEVFSAVFERTVEFAYPVSSVGTKQAWFGTVPAQAISDALTEVGQELVGGDGFGALKRRPAEWNIPAVLCGQAYEQDILTPGGLMSSLYADATAKTNESLKRFGLAKRGLVLKRISGFPRHQLSSVAALTGALNACESEFVSLLTEIEATDGFSFVEGERLEKAGVRLYRDDDSREGLQAHVRGVLESVVGAVTNGMREGQPVTPYFDRIDETIEKVEPRSSEDVLEAFAGSSFEDVNKLLATAETTAPKGFLLKVAVLAAKAWSSPIFCGIFGVSALFGILMSVDDLSGSTMLKAWIDPGSPLILIGEIALAVCVVIAIISGILLMYADSRIREWGKKLGLPSAIKRVKGHSDFVSQVALNDWVLNRLRRSAANPIRLFRECLMDLTSGLTRILIDPEDRTSLKQSKDRYNPAVRRSMTAGAKLGIFKNLPLVQKVLRGDVVRIIRHSVETHVYALLGKNAAGVSTQILEEVEQPLNKYIESVMRHGIYSRYHVVDPEEGEALRQQLIDDYWHESEAVAALLNDIVLSPDDEPIVQFIQPESLALLDGDTTRSCLIRFAPRPSRLDDVFLTNEQRLRISEVVLTKSASIGGVLRLIGFKEGSLG